MVKKSKYLTMFLLMGASAAMLAAPANASSVFVDAGSATPVLIGNLVAGHAYTITATGVANLATSANLTFSADGIPTYTLTGLFSFFSPNGSDYVPFQSVYGEGGPGNLFGALLGSYSNSPSGPFFMLGASSVVTPVQSEALYGTINDCVACYGDNAGGYTVTLTAVPEPTNWALMMIGVAGVGAAVRRKTSPARIAATR